MISNLVLCTEDYFVHRSVLLKSEFQGTLSATQFIKLYYNTVQCNTIQWNTVQCNTLQCNAVQCITFQCNSVCLCVFCDQGCCLDQGGQRSHVLYTVPCKSQSVYCTLYIVYHTVHSMRCILQYSVNCINYTIQCTSYIPHFNVQSV